MLRFLMEPAWITLGFVSVYAVLVTVGLVRAKRAEHAAYDVAGEMLEALRAQEWETLLLRSAVWVGASRSEDDEPGTLDLRA